MSTQRTLPFLLLALAACAGQPASEGLALRARADSIMKNDLGQLQLYAQAQDGSITPVSQYEVAPEGTKASLMVLRDSAGTVLLLSESPTSPREWTVEYRHYFDAQGHTAFFRRYSGFFDGCDWGLAKETLERSYTPEFKVADETYVITNDEGSPQDSTGCKFDYRFPYQVYPTWQAAATALKLPVTT